MPAYIDSTGWFRGSILPTLLGTILSPERPNRVLEIGSYEGLSACYISDYFLDHPESRLTCVDPFLPDPTTSDVTETTYKIFLHNISLSQNPEKITHHKQLSQDFFKGCKETYNFIYIDGDHRPEAVLADGEAAFQVLKPYGVIWFDDYKKNEEIKAALDRFQENHKKDLVCVYKDYQIGFQKLKSE